MRTHPACLVWLPLWIAACGVPSPQASPMPVVLTATSKPPPSAVAPSPWPTVTPVPATPTQSLPVALGTPSALGRQSINKSNLQDLVLTGQYGTGPIYSIAYSHDGQYVAVGTTTTVDILDGQTLHLLCRQQYQGLRSRAWRVRFSASDNEMLAIDDWSGSIATLGVKSCTEVKYVTRDHLYVLDVSEDTTSLLYASDGCAGTDPTVAWLLRIWSNEVVEVIPNDGRCGNWPRVAAYSPAANLVALAPGVASVNVEVWRLSDHTRVWAGPRASSSIEDILLSVDGRLLVYSSHLESGRGGDVYATEAGSGQLLWVRDLEARSIAISPDARFIAVSQGPGPLLVLDATTGKTVAEADLGRPAGPLTFVPSGDGLVVGLDQAVVLWDIASDQRVVSDAEYLAAWGSVSVEPSGKYVAFKESLWSFLGMLDLSSGSVVRQFEAVSGVFSPDGTRFATIAYPRIKGNLTIWSVPGFEVVLQPPIATYSVAFSLDSQAIAVSLVDGRVFLLDVATGETVDQFQSGPRSQLAVSFSPDGRWLVGKEDYGSLFTFWVWDTETQRVEGKLQYDDQPCHFSPFRLSGDGRLFAPVERDGGALGLASMSLPSLTASDAIQGAASFKMGMGCDFDLALTSGLLAIAGYDPSSLGAGPRMGFWDAVTYSRLQAPDIGSLGVYDIHFASDGTLLAGVSSSRELMTWAVIQP
jgi:WD40 repeat protein